MASNDNYEEKPNLRPTKRQTAGGKTIFLHHNPNHPSNKSYIHAIWNENSSSKPDPFGIEQPHVEYSLNKQQRWEVLNNFRQHITNQSSSSSDDELDIQSDSEQQQKKKKIRRRKRDLNTNHTKYRLYEFHNVNQQADCVGITSNTGQKRIQIPKKTYMQGPSHRSHEENQVDNAGNRGNDTANVSYYAVVPPPKEKQLSNIRKQHGAKGILIYIYIINIYSIIFTLIAKRVTESIQRSKFTQVKERMNAAEQLEDENEQTSSDDNDLIQYVNINLIYFC